MSFLASKGPLVGRVYRLRNPTMEFFCPLCRTERSFKTQPRLTKLNYLQVIFLTALVVIFTYPLMGIKALPIFFIFWAGFEMIQRLRFKREIPCPHCGFDATWYHRDVRVARTKVKEFWDKKNSLNVSGTDNSNDEESKVDPVTDEDLHREAQFSTNFDEPSATL